MLHCSAQNKPEDLALTKTNLKRVLRGFFGQEHGASHIPQFTNVVSASKGFSLGLPFLAVVNVQVKIVQRALDQAIPCVRLCPVQLSPSVANGA